MEAENKALEAADQRIRKFRSVVTGSMVGVSITMITVALGAKLPLNSTLLIALVCFAVGLVWMALGYILAAVFSELEMIFSAIPRLSNALDRAFTLLQTNGQLVAAAGMIAIFWYISPVMGIATIAVILLMLLVIVIIFLVSKPKKVPGTPVADEDQQLGQPVQASQESPGEADDALSQSGPAPHG